MVFYLLIFFTIFIKAEEAHLTKGIILTDPVIATIDGTAMTAEKIKEIKWTIQQMEFIQFGDIKDQKREGRYVVQGHKCSLKKLCKLENLKEEKPNLYKTIEKEITEILDIVKEDLGKATDNYLASNSGSKHLIRRFITEWSVKSSLPNTLLLVWARLPEGHDTVDFRKTFSSLNQIDLYCSHLTQFLQDFINSFPRAKEKYHAKYGPE